MNSKWGKSESLYDVKKNEFYMQFDSNIHIKKSNTYTSTRTELFGYVNSISVY